jgi:hypothetical protein
MTTDTTPVADTTTDVIATNPVIQSAIDTLNQYADAFAGLSLAQRKNVTGLPSDAERAVVIDALTSLNRSIRTGKIAPSHDATCHFLATNQPLDPDGRPYTPDTYVAFILGQLPESLRNTMPKLVADAETEARAQFVCDCALSRKRAGATRGNATDPGAKRTRVHGPAGEVLEFNSMSEATFKMAAWYPGATQAQKYVALIGAKKAANAKVFLMSDLKAGRLPKDSVEFLGAGESVATEDAPSA